MSNKLEVLITVKAYPNPSKTLGEAACIAGVSRAGKFVRLYPVPFRDLDDEQRFSKYQWIRVNVRNAKDDSRPETVRPDFSTIEVISRMLSTANNWAARYQHLKPLQAASMCDVQDAQARDRTSLGFFRPKEILEIETEHDESPTWTHDELAKLGQQDLFMTKERKPLEKIPVSFFYRFRCEGCRNKEPHRMKILDWELAELWRKDRRGHDEVTTIDRVKHRFLDEMCADDIDTHFFTGNMALHQSSFLILGVFWPKRSDQTSLF
jgi:hypothetical protein